MPSSNLPVPSSGGAVTRAITAYRLGRELEKYETQAFLATSREVIDQVAHADATAHAMALANHLLDVAEAAAGGNEAKRQLSAFLISSWVQATAARAEKRFGGAR